MSFGSDAFGELAFGEDADVALDADAWLEFLADVSAARCWLLEIDAFSLAATSARAAAFGDAGFAELGFGDADAGAAGGIVTLRYSTHGYISKVYTGGIAGGDPDYPYHYDGRIRDSIRIDRRAAGRSGIGGLVDTSADLELESGDGGLDDIPGNYALDGRAVRLYVGRPTDQRANFGLAFSGVVASSLFGLRTVRLTLSDGRAKLDQVVNATAYAGSGALEGGADLKGKPKPKTYGQVFNVSAPLVDSAKLIYQVHDGLASDVSAVYDRGVVLTKGADYTSISDLNTTAPSAGQYRQCLDSTGSYFRLGSTPAGTVTADVSGDASGAGYVAKTGALVLRLLALAGLATTEIDSTSFVNLNDAQGAAVGVWVGADSSRTIEAVVDELLTGIGAFGYFNRRGQFYVALITDPAAGDTPVATYTTEHIGDLEREPLPTAVEPIAWRALVEYQQNYTVQNDFAAAVTAARRTFAAAAQRVSKSEDSSIKSRYLLALEYQVRGLFAASADADAEALRLFNLWSTSRGLYKLPLPLEALTWDLGKVATIMHDRFGLSLGRPARALAHSVLPGNKIEVHALV
jgi:hypothetical protein